jgi:hypothetical protein
MATLKHQRSDENRTHDLERNLKFEGKILPQSETDMSPQSVGPQEKLHDSEGPESRGTLPTERVNPTEWTGHDDQYNPHNWGTWKRVYHAIIPALFGFAV